MNCPVYNPDMSDGSARDWTCSKPLISDSTPTTAHNLILCRKPFSETIFLLWCDQNSSSAGERTGRWLGDAWGCAWCEAAWLRKPITDNFCGKRSRNFPQSLAYHSGILGSERPGQRLLKASVRKFSSVTGPREVFFTLKAIDHIGSSAMFCA